MAVQPINSSSNEIFPTELWEMIIEELGDSSDIQNVLRAFPLVDVSVDNRRKRFWYLDKILPFVCRWIKQKDVWKLRLVCKKWEAKVNSFLHNLPRYRAYSHDLHGNNSDFWKFLSEETFQIKEYSLVIPGSHSFWCFEELMELPKDRNPFMCRRFQVVFKYSVEGLNLEHYLSRVINFLQKYGSHLCHLEFRCDYLYSDYFPRTIRAAIQMLKFVPNLKSLSFTGVFWALGEEKGFEVEDFPELPFLETIAVTNWFWYNFDLSAKVWTPLLKRYGVQIRRLELLAVGCDWDVESYTDLFPALTELKIQDFKQDLNLDNLFSSIEVPNLVKIELVSNNISLPLRLSMENDILKWLKLFPKIKYFGISSVKNFQVGNEIKEGGTSDPETDSIPSLQTLSFVDGHGVSYKFLKCFPNLRHLQISCRKKPAVFDLSTPDSNIQLREHIQTGNVYKSNVWECLRKLRTVTLQGFDSKKCLLDTGFKLDFDRDTYDKLKDAEMISNEIQGLRDDIFEFLQCPSQSRCFHRYCRSRR